MSRITALFALPLALAGCATVAPGAPPPDPALTWLRLGQTAPVDGPQITPLSLIEDSRCPAQVSCVWAGQVRVTVRVPNGGGGSKVVEVASRRPVPVADGTLELVEVRPTRRTEAAIPPGDYRLGFRFSGGL